MRPIVERCSLGIFPAGGLRLIAGAWLRARNSRYHPKDERRDRLWTLLGRSKYNSTVMPGGSASAPDDNTTKTIGTYQQESASKLWVHKGGNIFEGDLGPTGLMEDVFRIATATTPRGTPAPYKDFVYYPIGANQWSEQRHFLTRAPGGWRLGGHRTPTADFNVGPTGDGSFGSTTNVLCCYRVYDETTDTESARSDYFTLPAPGETHAAFRWTFPAGVQTDGELGTHVRLYRSLVNEPPGILYRCDDVTINKKGIPLSDMTTLFEYDEALDNDQIQIQGVVRADGEEGTNAWAEHGGPPPQARGGVMFQNHLVLWGIPGREIDIIYSANGYPESFPVNDSREYEYYLVMSSTKQDAVQRCLVIGSYLVVLSKGAVFRVTHLPTYTQPGFDRIIQDEIQSEHGCVGPWAADTFGIGDQESSYGIYVSQEHGPMLTNGIFTRPIMPRAFWKERVDPAYMGNTVVKNYAEFQEAWIAYTPKGQSRNTEAVILDYSQMGRTSQGMIRLTGPVDVQMIDAVQDQDTEGDRHLWLIDEQSRTVFVQDRGSTDEQKNYNESGDIPIEWGTRRFFPGGLSRVTDIERGMLHGTSGAQRQFLVKHSHLDGIEEYDDYDMVKLGPGETVDAFLAKATAHGHRTLLTYAGPTGSTYDEDDPDCAQCLNEIEYESTILGRQPRTS